MKNYKLFCCLFFTALILSLPGCSNNFYYLSQPEIAKYHSVGVNDFIRQELIEPRPSVFNQAFDKLDSAIVGLSKIIGTKPIKDPTHKSAILTKMQIYEAPYTGVNNKYLFKPVKDLSSFCGLRTGELKTIECLTKGSVSSFPKLIAEYLHTMTDENANDFRTATGVTPGVSLERLISQEDIALQNVESSSHIYYRLNMDGAEYGYADAVSQGAFGRFQCISKTSGKNLWSVNIIPVGFKPKTPDNQLLAHVLFIRVSPEI